MSVIPSDSATCVVASHWENGGDGAVELAREVVEMIEHHQPQFRMLYRDQVRLWEKTRRIVRGIYGAEDIMADKKIRQRFARLEDEGYGHYPICMAKTQYSFSTDRIAGWPAPFMRDRG